MRDAQKAAGRSRQAAPLLIFLLTGCGSDRPYNMPRPGPSYRVQTPAAKPAVVAPAEPPDPLVGDGVQTPADPLMGHDPLIGRDSLGGGAMPTQHSHWLQGRLHDARVTVLLNGVRYGTFAGVLSHEDITMRLREGANTVTFVYQPGSAASAGDLEVVEGEHHPPIAPLVSFHSQAIPAGGAQAMNGDPLRPVTQTFPFIAN